MHSPIRTRQSARKATIAAQAVAVVLIACGGVLAFAGLPGLDIQKPEPEAQPQDQSDPNSDQAGTQPSLDEHIPAMDTETIDWNLSLVSNAPVPDPEQPPDTGGEVTEVEPEEGIRYVGSIKIGGRAAAFVNVGGITKLLRPGGSDFEGVQLVSVGDGQIVISVDGGVEQTIEKSVRQGSAVSLVSGGAPGPTKGGVAIAGDEPPQPANFTPDMSREERREALLKRARGERSRWERDRGQGGGPSD